MAERKNQITNEMFEDFKDHRAKVNESNLMRYTIRFRRPDEKKLNDGDKIAFLNQYVSKEKGMTISDYMHNLLEQDIKKKIKEEGIDLEQMIAAEYGDNVGIEDKKNKKKIEITLAPGKQIAKDGVTKTLWKKN